MLAGGFWTVFLGFVSELAVFGLSLILLAKSTWFCQASLLLGVLETGALLTVLLSSILVTLTEAGSLRSAMLEGTLTGASFTFLMVALGLDTFAAGLGGLSAFSLFDISIVLD